MNPRNIRRWEALYGSARSYGAASILREHLGVGDDFIVPLSLAHGVDVGQMGRPLDIDSVEPAHWTFNSDLAAKAEAIKPAALVPHPVILFGDRQGSSRDLGTLVVGPPPSPANDLALFQCLERQGIAKATILVKARGEVAQSIGFWRANGFDVTTLGPPSAFDYRAMITLFARFDTMVCCTVSSAAYFMAALGGRVRFLDDYNVMAVESAGYASDFVAAWAQSAPAMCAMILADDVARTALTRELLGASIDRSNAAIMGQIDSAIVRATGPIHAAVKRPWPWNGLMNHAARISGRSGLIAVPLSRRLKRDARGLEVIRTNEIRYWLEGPSAQTFSASPLRELGADVKAGEAPDAYEG